MRELYAATVGLVLTIVSAQGAHAQVAQPNPPTSSGSVPRVINITGVFQPVDGQPLRPLETVTLAIYTDETGGTPLWQETQNVVIDTKGRYDLLLGAASAEGIPETVLAAGAQWLGMTFNRQGEGEGPRAQLTSVPYALRAADADTLGGRPASAYVLAPTGTTAKGTTSSSASGTAQSGNTQSNASADVVLAGTTNFLAKYVNAADVGNSALYENLGSVGLGTTAPLDMLHVKFTNTGGSLTGIAVQNMGNTNASYSGMLFYDQNGQLGQFQGFNNVTHEYRINNIASTPSINFMLGSASRFLVSSNGSVGVGTSSPDSTSNLDVSNAVTGSGSTNLQISAYAANGFGSNLIGKKARGTQAAPTAVLNNDGLLTLSGTGYGLNQFAAVSSGVISMRASEDWTNTAQGSYMNFATTANGTTGSINRMTINSNGNVGIGVFGAQAPLEVSNQNGAAGAGMIFNTSYANGGTSLFVGRRARGTGAAPTAVQTGDGLAAFVGRGRGATGFGGPFGAGMYVGAAENWTDTAQGARLFFNTTPIGATGDVARMTIDPSGNVGMGTASPAVNLEVSNLLTGTTSTTVFVTAGGNNPFGPEIQGRKNRVGVSGPTAPQVGDALAVFNGSGYGTTGFGVGVSGLSVIAQESFTDAAQGSSLFFSTIPLGTNVQVVSMALNPFGMLGVGTIGPLDRLQVVGDVRVGTSGTDGCVKNFSGTGIAGTCASDRRFKKNITPFGSVLDQVAALQPVHFNWRATEFPERHWGNSRAYGLIAQDVEEVLPELVVTGEDGFKAVDYSKLPLLTIQAVKDLKQRVADLERIIEEMRATMPRR
jgi:hypothetical protein